MSLVTAAPLGATTATLAEGVIPDGPDAVLWIDIPRGNVHRTTLDGRTTLLAALDEPVGCAVRDHSGRVVAGTPTGFRALDAAAGHPLLARLPEVSPDVRMNDGSADPAGRFVAGTMAYDETPGAGTLWSWDGDTVRALRRDVTISNGLAWSADDATLYYIDTPTRRIDAHAYGPDGSLGPRRTVAEVPGDLGAPDGMTIDADGHLWVALYGGGVIVRVDPATGSVVPQVSVPRQNPTSCALIEDGARTLLAITAAETRPDRGDGGLFVAEVDARRAPQHHLRVDGVG